MSGAGDDVLAGGIGGDTVAGEAGADIFAFRDLGEINVGGRRDLIADFSHADGDRIDLSALDANPDAIGTQHLTFIGAAKFSGIPGTYELRVTRPSRARTFTTSSSTPITTGSPTICSWSRRTGR